MARAIYEPRDNSAGLAGMFGLKPEDFESAPVEIWPENQPAVTLFQFLSTQWRAGMNGYIGLDFNVAYKKMDRMGLTPDQYNHLEEDLKALEYEALVTMNSNK